MMACSARVFAKLSLGGGLLTLPSVDWHLTNLIIFCYRLMVGFALSTYLFYLLVGGFALEID